MQRTRLALAALLVALAAAAALIAAAPAAARSTDDAPPAAAAADPVVEAYVAAARQYVSLAGPRIDAGVGRENDAIGACQARVDAAPARVRQQLGDLIANDLASATWRAMVTPYARLVTQLTDADAADSVLRAAAAGAWTLKQLQLPLLKPRLGVCRLVRQWQAARWAPSFAGRHPHEFAPALIGPGEQARAREAQPAIDAAARRLQELGATPGDATLFACAAGSSLIQP